MLYEFLNDHFLTAGSTEASLPLEKEEQVRLQARKRLEEQLRQYRVKRQQERVSLPDLNKLMGNFMCGKEKFDSISRTYLSLVCVCWDGLCFSGKITSLCSSHPSGRL